MKKFVQSCLRAQLEKLEAELDRAAETPKKRKAIHDLRVAIRRFTQCLRTFKQFFDPKDTKAIRKRLRKLMDLCGAARNCDVALELLSAAGLDDTKMGLELQDQRRRARKELAHKLPRWEKRWRFQLKANRENAGIWSVDLSARENASRVLPSLTAELFTAGDAARDGRLELHKFRLKVKRFRYTFELFKPVYRGDLDRGLTMLRGLQDKLGAISDCTATLAIVKRDRRATGAVRNLLASREPEFREYWAEHCGSEMREWWTTTLKGRAISSDPRGTNGTVHTETR